MAGGDPRTPPKTKRRLCQVPIAGGDPRTPPKTKWVAGTEEKLNKTQAHPPPPSHSLREQGRVAGRRNPLNFSSGGIYRENPDRFFPNRSKTAVAQRSAARELLPVAPRTDGAKGAKNGREGLARPAPRCALP